MSTVAPVTRGAALAPIELLNDDLLMLDADLSQRDTGIECRVIMDLAGPTASVRGNRALC